jgi:hypothetical protein
MAVLSTVTFLGAAVTEFAVLASLSVFATEAVGGDISLGIAGTKLGLAPSIAMAILATVALSGTTITKCATLACLSVLSTETIGRNISSIS